MKTVKEASDEAEVIMILLPDEYQPEVYKEEIEPGLRSRECLSIRPWF